MAVPGVTRPSEVGTGVALALGPELQRAARRHRLAAREWQQPHRAAAVRFHQPAEGRFVRALQDGDEVWRCGVGAAQVRGQRDGQHQATERGRRCQALPEAQALPQRGLGRWRMALDRQGWGRGCGHERLGDT